MNEEEALKQIAKERMQEKEMSDDMWRAYHPPKSVSYKRQEEIIKLKKQLNVLEGEENRIDPKLIEEKRRALARAVILHKREKALSDSVISMQFEQMTSPDGFTFKEKK